MLLGKIKQNMLPLGGVSCRGKMKPLASVQQPIRGARGLGEWKWYMGMILQYVGPCWCHAGPWTGYGPCCQHTCGRDPHPYAGSGSQMCWGDRQSDVQYRWISALFQRETRPLTTAAVYTHYLMHAYVDNWHIQSMWRYLIFHQYSCNVTLNATNRASHRWLHVTSSQ